MRPRPIKPTAESPVREFARAKVNLALHVLGRRPDGLHELDSIIAFADCGDELVFEPSSRFEIVASGPFAAALPEPDGNIITRAWRGLGRAAGGLPPVRVAVRKNLPLAAGLGGGSANAAATLRGLMRMFDVRLPDIARLAMSLGADVPACLPQATCRLRGAGEHITPLDGIGPFHAVLVNPPIQVSTAAVFQALALRPSGALDLADPAGWRNDLTGSARVLAPAIGTVLETIGKWTTPRMSGSGATCFGLFETEPTAAAATQAIARDHPQWWVRKVRLG